MSLISKPSSSNPSIDSQFAISTLPKNQKNRSLSNISSLYEIEYVPGDQLPETTLPLVNPYEYFAKRPSAFSIKGVRELIKPSSSRRVLEYVQSSKFSSCQVPATEEEQFISLNIPEHLPRIWRQQGYTHLHFGVVRIGLTLHARKGLPVVARIALLDSRLKTYQQACIGTVQTTLNAGTVFVTLFPNFNVSLQDPNLLKALKVQLQLIGAPMQEESIAATLHHQIVYRIQDHALDLALPATDEALYLEVTSASQAPNSIQIPRQISREELLRKLPESWVTSYEKIHQASQAPIQSTDVSFHSRNDGTTEIKFEKPKSSSFRRNLFTQFTIQIEEQESFDPLSEQGLQPISFNPNGSLVYPFKDEDGHCYFDVCNCTACTEDSYESDDEKRRRRRKKKDPLYRRYLEGDPTVGPLGDDKYDFIVEYSAKEKDPTPKIMMMHNTDFPPPKDFIKDNTVHTPKVIPNRITSSGPDELSQGEKVLNWQSENAIMQNQLLSTINHKVDQMSENTNRRLNSLQGAISEIQERLNSLHHEMMSMAKHMKTGTVQFKNKEAEQADLRYQLKDLQKSLDSLIQNQKQTHMYTSFDYMSPGIPTYRESYSPGFLSGYYERRPKQPAPGFLSSDDTFTSRFGITSLKTTNLPKTKPRRPKESDFQVHPSKKPSLASSSSQESIPDETKNNDKKKDIAMIEFSMSTLLDNITRTSGNETKEARNQDQPKPIAAITYISESSFSDSTSIFSESETNEVSLPNQFAIGESSNVPKDEPNIDEPSDDEDMGYEDIGNIGETPKAKHFASKILVFTLDDIPFDKWSSRLDEFHAWMTSEAITSPTETVIQQFTARLSGALKEWWNSLGEYRQLQVYQTTIPTLLGEIHREFVGTPSHLKEQLQEEFYAAKCCSLRKKDLAKHFERQTRRYYALNGLNNPSLKQVYISSIDDYLSHQTKLHIRDQGQTIEDISIGQIQQYVFRTLDKLCEQKKFWSEFMDKSKQFSQICTRPDLSIKCSKKKKCSCDDHKKRKFKNSFRKPKYFNKIRRKRYFRKKKSFKKTSKCFLCRKTGHFAKDCPNKSKKKKQYLIHSISQIAPDLDIDNHDLESVLSYDSNENDAICSYSDYEDSSESSSDDETNDHCFKITQIPQDDEFQSPHLPVTIFDPSKQEKPVHAIAFIDTGAHTTILNPKILSKSMWLPHQQNFKVANSGSLTVKLRSKPITIELFPGCQITKEVLGSSEPGKDLILGWDTYSILKNKFGISLEPRGVRWKNLYKAFTTMHRLFSIEESSLAEFEKIKEEITATSCADSHTEFLQKCTHPLWLNSDFFVSLPFKEDIHTTPTKASHAGMPPTLLQKANEECNQLIEQGVVSRTNSPWACKAFYVNNRAEQARGKLRLVIDYKPLNQYLQDVKFPLPNKRALLQHLQDAKIFSKFDLKSGFWQLGVHPEERYKTAFCLPNSHLQWNVLPFGLKTAPSLFQQAMLRIFEPLLHTALIYIDDILIFSANEEEHVRALQQFHDIVKKAGIMLSARKMMIAQSNIDFLGMQIKEGSFVPQAHLATELLNFPDENLTKRQIQQFLGVINYVGDFIPHLSKMTRPLQKMLSKNPPLWTTRQTEAIKSLKAEVQKLPSLKIPSIGLRVIQTDASDKYWGAILFEEIDGKRRICGYKSGRFKDSEQHYHSTFKEILAVKKAIERFEFHLIGHRFRIEMDMSSFPKMLQFKQKMVPHQQLLRWSEWFSKYDFDSVYLKGTKNTLADMLSRKPVKQEAAHAILMMASSSSSSSKKSLYDFEADIPEDTHELIGRNKLHELLHSKIFLYQSMILSNYGVNCRHITPMGIHPDYPFAHLFRIENSNMPEEVLCFLWYLCAVYTVGISFDISWLYYYVNNVQDERNCFSTFLKWFSPLSVWSRKLRKSARMTNLPFKKLKQGGLNPFFNPHTIYFFHRPVKVHKTNKVYALPTLIHHGDFARGVRPDFNIRDTQAYEGFQIHAFHLNNSRQTFPIPFIPNWIYYPVEYQMQLDEDLQFYMMNSKKQGDRLKAVFQEEEKPTSSQEQNPSQEKSHEYSNDLFQDAQLPNDEMNIDEIEEIEEKFKFCTTDRTDEEAQKLEEAEKEVYYGCPDNYCPNDHYGCCEEHMLEFEMDH